MLNNMNDSDELMVDYVIGKNKSVGTTSILYLLINLLIRKEQRDVIFD